jgi:hypothetical protein
MRSGSLRFYAACVATVLCGTAAVVACGSADSELNAFGPPSANQDSGASGSSSGGSFNDAGFPGDAATMIPANGIVIVHAASFGAFRLCFKNVGGRRPIPSADLLPESNLVGVDVGSAVRIDPIKGSPGTAYAFDVDDIKTYYPPGQAGPTCNDLVTGQAFQYAHEVAEIATDLAFGVHLLVLRGSLAAQDLRLETIELNAFNRPYQTLPVQVLHLAQNLEARAANRKLGVAVGLVSSDGGDAGPPAPFIEGQFDAGVPMPTMPYPLDYDPADESVYATSGFFVTLGGPLDAGTGDAGTVKREVLLAQSLADIQRLSAPRALPGPWFNAPSSFVLLLLGNAQETDANADELTRLHFLAVPMAAPPTAGDAGEPIGDATTD